MSYAVHRLALLIPAMSESEYAEHRDDVAAEGLHDPITLYEGKILDGRHRQRACDETGREPRYEEYDGDAPASFVISKNLKRRQLSASQRAMIAADLMPELQREARERQGHGLTAPGRSLERSGSIDPERSQPIRARDLAGAAVGVSGVSVSRATRVKEQAPELAEEVRAGRLAVHAAERELRGRTDGAKPSTPRRAGRSAIPALWEIALGWEGNADHILHPSFDLAAEVAVLSPEQFADCRHALARTASAIAALRRHIPTKES